jgi:lysophospholipase L1-like esterase
VFSFGANDCTLEDEMPRVPPEVTEENAAALLGWAAARWPVLMVGPPPLAHDAAHDARVAALSRRLAALCDVMDLAFLDAHAPLSAGNAWRHAATRGDGVHPDGSGYAALAALVDGWAPWRALVEA